MTVRLIHVGQTILSEMIVVKQEMEIQRSKFSFELFIKNN